MDLIKQGYILISRSSIIVPLVSINKPLSEINSILSNKFVLKYTNSFGISNNILLYRMYNNEYLILPKASLTLGMECQLINYDKIIIPVLVKQDAILDADMNELYKKGDLLLDVIRYMDKQGLKHKFTKSQLRIMKKIMNEKKISESVKPIQNHDEDESFSESVNNIGKINTCNINELIKSHKSVKSTSKKKEIKLSKNPFDVKGKFICDYYENHDFDINDTLDSNRYYPPTPKLYNNQILVCDYLMTYIYGPVLSKKQTKTAGCILVAPTGEGKTHIMMGLFNKIGGKMLIVVPNEVILEQTVNVAETAYGTDEEIKQMNIDSEIIFRKPKVTTYYGKNKDLSGDIIVAIVNSMIVQDANFFDQFTFVSFDEAPNYCSDSFSKIFWIGQCKCTMAVTATPFDRVDGFDKMLNYHIGPYVFVQEIPGFIASNDNFKFEFNIIPYVGPSEYTKNELMSNGGIFCSKIITNLCKDPYRLSLIINRIQTYYKQNRHVYVFCDRRIYCHIIAKILSILETNINMCKDEQIESENNNYSYIVMGGVSKDKLKEAYDAECDASVVITTYDYLKVGVSIPRMDTMILTSPRRSGLTQIIGRISRRGGDVSKVRIVDDIYDVKTIFRGQLVDRLAAYKLRNGKIKKYNKIKYTAFEGELVNLCVKFINELSVNGLLFDNQVVEEKEVIEEKEEVIKSNNKINDIETIDKEEITPKQEVNNMLGLLKLNVKLMLMVIDELKITEVNRNNTKFDVTKLSPNLKKEVIKYAKLVVDEQGNIISNKEEKIIDVLGRDTSNLAVSYSEDNLEPNKNINTILSSTTYTANDIVTTKKKEIVKPVKKTNISIEQKIKDFKL
jgi:superfamily II DNA or RNA helicase